MGDDDDDADVVLEVCNILTGWTCEEGMVRAERPFACEIDLRLLALKGGPSRHPMDYIHVLGSSRSVRVVEV